MFDCSLPPSRSPREPRTMINHCPAPGNTALGKLFMLMIDDFVVYTGSNEPCCTSWPGLLCTNIKIDGTHLKGTSSLVGLCKEMKGAGMSILEACYLASGQPRNCLLHTPQSSQKVSCSLLVLDPNQKIVSSNLETNISALAIVFSPRTDLPQELRTYPTVSRVISVTHTCIICR